jgi:3-methyladenine DNA glycosylase Tag
MWTADELWERATARKGERELTARLPVPRTRAALRRVTDDRYLADITRRVFQAGFVWRVIETKWPGFEEAFHHFDVDFVRSLDADGLDELANDARIVRNRQKILATIANAAYVHAVAAEHGRYGAFLAAWPADDPIGLWAHLAKSASRLGGDSGPRFLRGVGWDTFILTPDVVRCLQAAGALTARHTSKAGKQQAQAAFLAWREASGRSLSALSVIAACAVD